jgi:hypothetical protein
MTEQQIIDHINNLEVTVLESIKESFESNTAIIEIKASNASDEQDMMVGIPTLNVIVNEHVLFSGNTYADCLNAAMFIEETISFREYEVEEDPNQPLVTYVPTILFFPADKINECGERGYRTRAEFFEGTRDEVAAHVTENYRFSLSVVCLESESDSGGFTIIPHMNTPKLGYSVDIKVFDDNNFPIYMSAKTINAYSESMALFNIFQMLHEKYGEGLDREKISITFYNDIS